MSERIIATMRKRGADGGFQEEVHRLSQHVGQVQDDLAEAAESAGEAVLSTVVAAKENGRRVLGIAKEKGESGSASLRGQVVNHPGTTLGIAVGVGVLIGLVGPVIARSLRRSS